MMTRWQFYVALAVLAVSLLAGCRDRDDSASVDRESQAPQQEGRSSPEDEGAVVSSSDHPWEQPGTKAGQEIVGPAGIALVWVPGGSFLMGEDNGAARWRTNEEPVHRVELSGFWIGKTEVTVAQWRSVMGSVPDEYMNQRDDHPVLEVSLSDCVDFCEKTGLALPTEAQWEYAARGPESRRYPWGDEWDPERLCWDKNRGPRIRTLPLDDPRRRDPRTPGGNTFPAGSFPSGASWCGAMDMAGNVREWCADRYDEDYYGGSPVRDPVGPPSGTRGVLRSGSFRFGGPRSCRSAARCPAEPGATYLDDGFRVAKDCR
jgi:sulfatase modifying factor 1